MSQASPQAAAKVGSSPAPIQGRNVKSVDTDFEKSFFDSLTKWNAQHAYPTQHVPNPEPGPATKLPMPNIVTIREPSFAALNLPIFHGLAFIYNISNKVGPYEGLRKERGLCYREEAVSLFDECPPREKVKEHDWQDRPDRKMYARHFVVEKSYKCIENEYRCTLYTRKFPAYWNSQYDNTRANYWKGRNQNVTDWEYDVIIVTRINGKEIPEAEISARIPKPWNENGWLEPKWNNIVRALQDRRIGLLRRHGLQEPLARMQAPHANNAAIQKLGYRPQLASQGQVTGTVQGQGKQPVLTGDNLLRRAVMNNSQVQGQQGQSQRSLSSAGPNIPRQALEMDNIQTHGQHSAASNQSLQVGRSAQPIMTDQALKRPLASSRQAQVPPSNTEGIPTPVATNNFQQQMVPDSRIPPNSHYPLDQAIMSNIQTHAPGMTTNGQNKGPSNLVASQGNGVVDFWANVGNASWQLQNGHPIVTAGASAQQYAAYVAQSSPAVSSGKRLRQSGSTDGDQYNPVKRRRYEQSQLQKHPRPPITPPKPNVISAENSGVVQQTQFTPPTSVSPDVIGCETVGFEQNLRANSLMDQPQRALGNAAASHSHLSPIQPQATSFMQQSVSAQVPPTNLAHQQMVFPEHQLLYGSVQAQVPNQYVQAQVPNRYSGVKSEIQYMNPYAYPPQAGAQGHIDHRDPEWETVQNGGMGPTGAPRIPDQGTPSNCTPKQLNFMYDIKHLPGYDRQEVLGDYRMQMLIQQQREGMARDREMAQRKTDETHHWIERNRGLQ